MRFQCAFTFFGKLIYVAVDIKELPVLTLRRFEPKDEWFLQGMLYEAIYIAENEKPLPESIINLPELSKYVKNFGRIGDIGLIAEREGELVGAVWCRLFTDEERGYGFVDEYTPELSMAVKSGRRGQGIGTQLLENMLQALVAEGYTQVSLSVDRRNPALHLYKRLGFQVHEEAGTAYTMVKTLPQ